MDTDLTAIQQRAEAALIGPWENDELLEISGPGAVAIAQVHGPDDFPCLDEDADIDALQQEAEDTAAFIAHARADIPNLLDRLEALEKALVTARTALETARDWVGWTADCPQHSPGVQDILTGIDADLTEIAGVTGAEPCKHEWVVKAAHAAGLVLRGEFTDEYTFCASCAITTADKVTP